MSTFNNIILSSEKLRTQRDFWIDKLKEYEVEEIFNYYTSHISDSSKNISFNSLKYSLDLDLSEKLVRLSKNSDISLFIIIFSAFQYLMYRYTGKSEIYIGCPVHSKAGNINLVNNAIVIGHKFEESQTFKDIIISIKGEYIKNQGNQDYPFDNIINELESVSQKNYRSLFDIVITSENIHHYDACNSDNTRLVIQIMKEENSIILKYIYNSSIYEKEVLDEINGYLKYILMQVTDDVNKRLEEIDILSEIEKKQVIYDFNNSSAEYPREKVIHKLFEEQVDKTPNSVVIEFQDRQIKYSELNRKSNQLARTLRMNGVKPNTIVGLMVKPSIEMIVGILGILKAGGAYLPLDIEYPTNRLDYMIQDSKISILLTQKELNKSYNFNGNVINLDDDIYSGDDSNLTVVNSPEDLAYIIYTSGSTGKPKGAMIKNIGLVNYIYWSKKVYLQGEKFDFPLYSSLSFDLTVTSIFTPIISGGMIVIYGVNNKELLINKVIEDDKVDIVKLTPSHLEVIKNLDFSKSRIKKFIVGGENLKTELAKHIYNAFNGNIQIYNEYGPTETVVGCMIHKFNPVEDIRNSVPIGVPGDNVQIYLLDNKLNPVPKNAVGELYIGGDGVALGYLNNPELTNMKFADNIFTAKGKMYRTGDLARRLSNGNIEFVDRNDCQVKIRGYRIELGEIETQISKFSNIQEVKVIDRSDKEGNKHLCAYIAGNSNIDISELRKYLINKLPSYMIPQYFITLSKLPLTKNGKFNQLELPEPESYLKEEKCVPPRDEVESMLVDIWKAIMKTDSIGITNNFFHIGGDSIKAIKIASSAFKLGFRIELNDILQYPTIEELAPFVKTLKKQVNINNPHASSELTPMQKRLINQKDKDSTFQYQLMVLEKSDGFDVEIVKHSFKKIIEQHDLLKYAYCINDAEIRLDSKILLDENFIVEAVNLPVITYISDKTLEEVRRLYKFTNLTRRPLIKLVFLKDNVNSQFLIGIHKCIVDFISWTIILDDFSKAYTSCLNNKEIVLFDKTDSYSKWAEEIKRYSNSESYNDELEYWNTFNERSLSEFCESNKVIIKDSDMDSITVTLSENYTQNLLYNINNIYNTEVMDILLIAFGQALQECLVSDKFMIDIKYNGRDYKLGDSNVQRTIGNFISIYPFIIDMTKSENVSYLIKYIKDELRRVPTKGLGLQVIRSALAQKSNENIDLNDRLDICFDYLGRVEHDASKSIFNISENIIDLNFKLNSENLYPLEVKSLIWNTKLIVKFIYSKNTYQSKLILDLAESYKSNLCDLIDHCLQHDQVELSLSDIQYKDISIDELGMLTEEIIEKVRGEL